MSGTIRNHSLKRSLNYLGQGAGKGGSSLRYQATAGNSTSQLCQPSSTHRESQ